MELFSFVRDILESAETADAHLPATVLYNEGWLLRLVLHSAAAGIDCLPFRLEPKARWFSEALLYSAFLARRRGDELAESWTHADAVVGHFHFDGTKAGVVLDSAAGQFIVCEAKIFSGLSKGTRRAVDYDQAARNVACMAWTLKMADRPITEYKSLGFYVFAPQQQIDQGVFGEHVTGASIRRKIANRIAAFEPEWRTTRLEPWQTKWVHALLERIEMQVVAWETIVNRIQSVDASFGSEIASFYAKCLRYCAEMGSAGISNEAVE